MGREFLGREWLYQVGLGELRLRLRLPIEVDLPRGQRGRLALAAGERAWLYPHGLEFEAL
jgi:iron(III) transport system ATP-binding protein